MRETLATILWEGWTALVLCAAAVFLPGSEGYVQAANSYLGEQLLFGSSYTFRPIRQSIEDALYRHLILRQ